MLSIVRTIPYRLLCQAALIVLLSTRFVSADELIPKVTTRTGESFEQVKVVSRMGETIKIMHSGGIKILSLRDFDREEAIALGLLEYEVEKQIAAEDAAKKAEREEAARKALSGARERYMAEIRSKKLRTFQEWLSLLLLSGSTVNLSTLKAFIGRPPDFQSGEIYTWEKVCWNPDTERMDSLTLSPSSVPRLIDNQVVRLKIQILECGSESFASFDRTNAEFTDALDKRLLAPK